MNTIDRPTVPVTPANWQHPALIRWSFSHVDEVLPTAVIAAGPSAAAELPRTIVDLGRLPVIGPLGERLSVDEILRLTNTDAWLVWHHGQLLTEEYRVGMTPSTLHLLQSVSKSLTSTVIGSLVGQHVVDPEHLVTDYVPELALSGYAGATVRQLLDMRSGVGFREDYLDPTSDSRRLEATVGWEPWTAPSQRGTLRSFVRGLRQIRPHGADFDYRSCETDVLGLVAEGATGQRFPQLASELLWTKIGAADAARICVDTEGTGVFDGGICASLRDLARFGATIIGDGTSLTGAQVVQPDWVADIFAGGPDSAQAFAGSALELGMPGGMYRSQFWFPSASRSVAVALGIHGQMIYLDRRAQFVGVKLSSWHAPLDSWKSGATLAMFATIAQHTSGAEQGGIR